MLWVKQKWLGSPATILAGGFILTTIGALATAYAIWSSRVVALRQWQSQLSTTTHMLTAHAVQTIDAADIMLRAAHDNLQNAQVTHEPDFRATAETYRVHEILEEALNGLPQLIEISILANDGTLLNVSGQYPPPRINLADQDYFRAFANTPALELTFSRLGKNHLTSEPCFYLARPIHSPSGERLGLVATSLSSTFFSTFYKSAILGDLRISLARRDGTLLARNFDLPEPLGEKSLLSSEILQHFWTAESGIHFIGGQGTRHSFEEMVAFERSPLLPIGMSVAVSKQLIFSEWEKQAINFAALGGSLITLLIILTLLLSRLVRQLEQARNAALVAADAKTRFIANISHELRTPMNAIIAGAHQLQQASLAPDAGRTLQIVSSSAQQLTVLINDILDFSYFDTREFRIEKAPFDPRFLTQNAMDMVRALAPESKLELISKVDAKVPALIIGDANRIKQIILNLLNNAIKYTEHGQVELRVSYIRANQNLLILQVIDTGPGISDEDHLRIFEPFERTAWAKQKPGTGLGLAICQKLAQAMSGKITLQRKKESGAHFTVDIPAPEAQPYPIMEPHPDTEAANLTPSLHILIAEDVAPSRTLLTLMLEKMGHRVTAVENGLEAVYAASQTPFDLILMDLQMPEMDGISATRRIRTPGGLNQSTRIIAVSANADIDGPQGLIAAGFDDALLKPVKPERLSFVLAAMTARS